jgi:hypothetical protein
MITKAGTYRSKPVEVMMGKSKDKGTPFVGVMFEVVGGDFNGQKLKWEGYLTEKTAERTLESLQHCGWTGDDLSVFAKPEGAKLLTNEVDLVVEMEPGIKDDGKEYPKVQWVNRAGSGPKFTGAALDAGEAAAFGQKFRGLALALKAKKGEAPATKQQSIDDEIPF